MIRTLFAICLAAAAAHAETLADAVTARQPRLMDPAQILAELTARPQIAMTNIVVMAKPADQLAWERGAVVEVEAFVEAVTGSKTNAIKRVAALDSAQMLAAVRGGKKAQPGKREDIMDKSDSLVLFYLDAQRKGYPWPLPDDFGQETTTAAVVTTVPGKAWWQREGLKSPPTIDQISNLMK